jgi:molecular chaperone HtpG
MVETENPKIGKFIIDILTTSMYEDCRFIYREYIQNSADQIDKAVRQGLLNKSEESIFINIDESIKRIEIEDNATGIKQKDFAPILLNVAESKKERGKDKGFRGIGRLGGLGYCGKLKFETSFKGENVKSVLIWDAQLLKQIINDKESNEEAIEVINKVTKITSHAEDEEKHYFKVVLENVTNDVLLNLNSVEEYLKMVAPIPYQTGFIFKSKIKEFAKELNVSIDEYKIYLNGNLVYRPYTTSIYTQNNGNKKKLEDDEVFDIHFFKEYNDKQLLYWGWHSISTFTKQLDSCNLARGIRLRKDNIQIGSDVTLIKLFREQRGNFYFFGEVHAVDPDLIPNSRRDYFSENKTLHLFESKLKKLFHSELHKLYHDASKIRSANKEILSFVELMKHVEKQENEGFTNKEQKTKLYKELEEKKAKAENAKKQLASVKQKVLDDSTPVAKIYSRIVDTQNIIPSEMNIEPNDKTTHFRTDNISKLNSAERKFLSKIFSIIEKVLSKDLAKNLIEKIEEELKK